MDRIRSLGRWPDVLQSAKAAVAALVSWLLAAEVFGLHDPFLAPWAALLVVQATVLRSVTVGFSQAGATLSGVVLAWAVGQAWGLSICSLALVLVLGFVVAQLPRLRDEATLLVATAVVVLGTMTLDEDRLLFGRLLDTALGITVGVVVNLLMWPPLRNQAAAEEARSVLRRLAELLRRVADGVGPDLLPEEVSEWITQAREVDHALSRAWTLREEARQSQALNLRTMKRKGRMLPLGDTLRSLEEAVAELRGILRTINASARLGNVWLDAFRTTWSQLLTGLADAVEHGDEAQVTAVREQLDALRRQLSGGSLAEQHWQEYGDLLASVRNLAEALAPVIREGVSTDQPAFGRGVG